MTGKVGSSAVVATAAVLLHVSICLTATSVLAADPAIKCESGKLKTAGKYSSCRLSAESKGVKKGEAPDYSKCEEKFGIKWASDEAKGEGMCPAGDGDQAPLQDFIDACDESVAVALAGGVLPTDVVTCNTDLATCTGDLGTCNGDLSICSGDLGTCTGDLGTCNGDLSTCNGDLSTCSGDLGTCTGDLGTCNGDLSTCSGDLAVCQVAAACGNGVIEGGEECEFGDLNGQTCGSFGMFGAGLSCGADCMLDLSPCFVSRFKNTGVTIIDNATGYEWEKKTVGNVGNTFTLSTVGGTLDNGTAFTSHLATLNNCLMNGSAVLTTTGFAGHCDWRVPTYYEYATIPKPISTIFGPDAATFHWTKFGYDATPTLGWLLQSGVGGSTLSARSNGFPVRAVRLADADDLAADGGCWLQGGAGCSSCDCETPVCAVDPYCCSTNWDSACVFECNAFGGGNCP